MELLQIQQSPRIQKISKSSLQFRQLIDSLRQNLKTNRPSKVEETEQHPIQPQKDVETKDQSTVIVQQNKVASHNNNFLLHQDTEDGLKIKPKIEVGDRDKLKKKAINLDNNPELQYTHSKAIHKIEKPTSIIQQKDRKQQSLTQSHKKGVNVSTQYQFQSSSFNTSIIAPRNNGNNGKAGQIMKQNFKVDVEQPSHQETRKIKDINEDIIIDYCRKQKKITEKSTPSEIFTFFANLILECGIIIKSPHIKKYKNCIYFGFSIEKDMGYEGFLYFYDGKIYFGEFFNGFKHGLGVEINFNQNIKMKGEFKQGHKTGKFYIDKPTQKYIGFLQNGLYQGEGRLTKEDYTYEGMFDRGQKNGYGEQFYPKTGVRITGHFENGVLQKVKGSKSIPEIKNKPKSHSVHQKDRLEMIRKKSLEKHNFRMNKIRERSFRDSEYEMQFENTQQYSEPKISYNTSKLEVYRQPLQKLPKICHEFEYSHELAQKMKSIQIHQHPKKDFLPSAFRSTKKSEYQGNGTQRMITNQFEEPLPTPCLTVVRGRR